MGGKFGGPKNGQEAVPNISKRLLIDVAEDDLGKTIGAIAAIIIGGAIAAAILAALTQAPCPYCNRRIPKGTQQCPNCGSYLNW